MCSIPLKLIKPFASILCFQDGASRLTALHINLLSTFCTNVFFAFHSCPDLGEDDKKRNA